MPKETYKDFYFVIYFFLFQNDLAKQKKDDNTHISAREKKYKQ